ncbi:MAG: 4-carboxymuconolactone decarboxylase [Rhodobacteraceae bacterium]|nr:4-carboxymuconolactone decarboxylase [Paracoccaceae bacterium]
MNNKPIKTTLNSQEEDMGTEIRKKVLGTIHVANAKANTTEFDKPFQDFITAGAWGRVWARPHLTLREKSILTIALLASMGHDEELEMHLKATKNTGASAQDISEALLHVAVYAGVPAANNAIKIAKRVYQENESIREKQK